MLRSVIRKLDLGLSRCLDALLATALFAMAVVIIWQVVSRYVLNMAPSWSEEAARYLMPWITMLGSAAVIRDDGHIAVSGHLDRLPRGLTAALVLVRDAAILLTAAVLGWYGALFTQLGRRQLSAAMEIPMSLPYAALPVGAVLIAVALLVHRLARRPPGDGGDEPAVGV